MRQFRLLVAFFIGLSSMIAQSSDLYSGKISFKFYDTEGVCIGTLLNTGKVLTNHHCILDENGIPVKELYFQLKPKFGKPHSIELEIPEYIRLYDVNDVDNLTKDIIFLSPKKGQIKFSFSKAPETSCGNNIHKMYTMGSESGYCIVRSWTSGIYTSNNCVFEKGLSGTPFYEDPSMTKICGMYTLTINNKSNGKGLGVAIKVEKK